MGQIISDVTDILNNQNAKKSDILAFVHTIASDFWNRMNVSALSVAKTS